MLGHFGFLQTAGRATIIQGVEQLGNTQAFHTEQHLLGSFFQLFGQVEHRLSLAASDHLLTGLLVVLVVFVVVLGLILLAFGILVFSGRMLGGLIKAAIEKYDKEVIGVDVTLGDLQVALYTGKLWLHDLIIQNPAPYSAPYMLKVSEVLIDIDVMALLLSRFKKLELQCVIFRDVDAIWEKSGPFHSNIKQTLEFMEARQARKDKQKDPEKGDPKKEIKERGVAVEKSVASEPASADEKQTTIVIHELAIKDVGVKAASHILHGEGVRMALGDIRYDDFAKEQEAGLVDDIISLILRSFLKTVITNSLGKTVGNHLF